MSNFWINKKIEKKEVETKRKLYAKRITNAAIANEINQWLHQKGKSVLTYQNYLDRVIDLMDVIKIATEKAEKIIAENPERIL